MLLIVCKIDTSSLFAPSLCFSGKDEIIFVTKADFGGTNNTGVGSGNPLLPGGEDGEAAVGLIKENGEINWDCPCLQGMGGGPCGEEFKDAFSCFHYSESEPKGSDCIQQFQSMQECFQKHPEVYAGLDDDEDDDKKNGDEKQPQLQENESETDTEIAGNDSSAIESESELEANTSDSNEDEENFSEQLEKVSVGSEEE